MWCSSFGQQIHECLCMLTLCVHSTIFITSMIMRQFWEMLHFQYCILSPPKYVVYHFTFKNFTLDLHASKVDSDGVYSMSFRQEGSTVDSVAFAVYWTWYITSIVVDITGQIAVSSLGTVNCKESQGFYVNNVTGSSEPTFLVSRLRCH